MPRGQKLRVNQTGTHFYVCDCGFKTKSDTGMKLHLKCSHGGKITVEDETMSNKIKTCPTCREIFQNFLDLKKHIMKTRHAHVN